MSEVGEAAPKPPSESPPPATEGATEPLKADAAATPSAKASSWLDRTTVIWLVGIAILFCAEMYIYGRNGRIQVCVGIEGITDYTLLDTPRADAKVSQYPFCAERLNVGMYAHSEKAAEEALNSVCGRASALVRIEKTDCVRKENGWTRKVTREHLPPWDKRVYRRLLWLE